jgi:hypothetical protein
MLSKNQHFMICGVIIIPINVMPLAIRSPYVYLTGMDNIYKEGTFINAKSDPDRKLIINRYVKRIYYCKAVNDPEGKLLAYFERELIAPMSPK